MNMRKIERVMKPEPACAALRTAGVALFTTMLLIACSSPGTGPSTYRPVEIRIGPSGPQEIVVRNDPGGLVLPRIREIEEINRARAPVRISGQDCASSCTLYLGARQVCTEPGVLFRFHGPSAKGRPLDPEYHDRIVKIMARHYPDRIRQWFLNGPSEETAGTINLSAAEVHRHGIPYCDTGRDPTSR